MIRLERRRPNERPGAGARCFIVILVISSSCGGIDHFGDGAVDGVGSTDSQGPDLRRDGEATETGGDGGGGGIRDAGPGDDSATGGEAGTGAVAGRAGNGGQAGLSTPGTGGAGNPIGTGGFFQGTGGAAGQRAIAGASGTGGSGSGGPSGGRGGGPATGTAGTGGAAGFGGGKSGSAGGTAGAAGGTAGATGGTAGATGGTAGAGGALTGTGGATAGAAGAAAGAGGATAGTGGIRCDEGYFSQGTRCHRAAIDIALGDGHACALIGDGSVWCWGGNSDGELGNGTVSYTKSLVPGKVPGIDNAIGISAGSFHTCVLLQDGAVKCWGLNGSYQLGSASPQSSGAPITVGGLQGVTAVACGGYFSCALSAGSVRCWGSNYTDTLGSGKSTDALGVTATPVPVAGVTTAVVLATGPANGCVVLASGSVQCWGFTSNGQLGVVPPYEGAVPSPLTIAGITAPTAVTIGEYHICGLVAGGAIKCWGQDADGELGDGHLTSQSATPLNVVGISGATAIDAGELDTCAIGSDGLVRCWGYGGLGNGGTQSSSSLTPVVVMGLRDARKLSVNIRTGCAVRADGSVACWGDNYSGVLGDGGAHDYGGSAVPVTATW